MDPPFCGAHCDNFIPPEGFLEDSVIDSREESGVAEAEDSHPPIGTEEDSLGERTLPSNVASSSSDKVDSSEHS